MTSDADPKDEPMPSAKPREMLSVYSSVSGKAETFDDPREAGRAFFLADPAERPSVTHLVGNSARTMARTEIHGVHPDGGPKYFKSLPASHAPDAAFREGFLEAMEQSLKERLGQIAAAKDPSQAFRFDSQLLDDLESFAYRAPGKAALVWSGHSSERPPGPVLKAAVEPYVAGAGRDAAVGRTVEGEVLPSSLRPSGSLQNAASLRVSKQSDDWQR